VQAVILAYINWIILCKQIDLSEEQETALLVKSRGVLRHSYSDHKFIRAIQDNSGWAGIRLTHTSSKFWIRAKEVRSQGL
jgi:hypothetical protein